MSHVLFLGAGSDIARALAVKFASHGFNCFLAGRDIEDLKRSANDLKLRYKIEASACFFDAMDFESHYRFYTELDPKPLGVVCSFGYLGGQKTAESDFNEAEKIIFSNYLGCVSILNISANFMEKERNGFIIGISSVAGDRGRRSNYFYGSAKAGLTAYLSGLRSRLSKSGVHVMTVKPGFVKTKMTSGVKLPPLITALPEKTASDIFTGWKKKKNVMYTTGIWKLIMGVVKMIPEGIFKKLNV